MSWKLKHKRLTGDFNEATYHKVLKARAGIIEVEDEAMMKTLLKRDYVLVGSEGTPAPRPAPKPAPAAKKAIEHAAETEGRKARKKKGP